jgi:hypothetical protein
MTSMTKQAAAPETADLVAQLEAQLGDTLKKARADFAENLKERARLDQRRQELIARKTSVEANHKQLLIEHGKGVQGAAAKRNKVERELADIIQEIEAVDAAIVYESEQGTVLGSSLDEMEGKLKDAHKRQVQMQIAEILTEKKEAFITAFTNSCTLLAEVVRLADQLIAADGRTYIEQILEDLLFRTNRGILMDSYKYTEVQSGLGLAQRIFEVKALVPPPETE